MKTEPYTFLVFSAGHRAHAVERHPDNINLWRTLCGAEHHRTTGALVRGAKCCLACMTEVRHRGTSYPPSRKKQV